MKKFAAFLLLLVLLATFTDATPLLSEKQAKQVLRSKRSNRPRKAGHPDEPMRVKANVPNKAEALCHCVHSRCR
ncbi:hypothetical protein NDU88_008095 [Pleurodeles waltl]|uniref:Conotoxin n=1 Tax=Pleurodeles waltl TaxID=8319 RepID=A0AAV7PR57_PLEWA|nr:hypothetical protein NDU88_008095 [Pleurodeles waltl]